MGPNYIKRKEKNEDQNNLLRFKLETVFKIIENVYALS